jgi:crotonobetaine/carnitine-CoA ligase
LVLPHYLKDEAETARALRDGSFYTGDLGSKDSQGNFYFHGRKGDSVRTKGENVSSFEVEHVISEHPDVEECAMIGVPGEFGENDIKIFLRIRSGRQANFPALAEWCSPRMATFQIPRYFAEVQEFEKTPSKRIKKHMLPESTQDCWDRLHPNGRILS